MQGAIGYKSKKAIAPTSKSKELRSENEEVLYFQELQIQIENQNSIEIEKALSVITEFCKRNQIEEIPNIKIVYDIINLLSPDTPINLIIQTLKLLQAIFSHEYNQITQLFIQANIVEKIIQLCSNPSLECECLKCICNISGGSQEDLLKVKEVFTFDVISNVINETNSFFYCRIIRNICSQQLNIEDCSKVFILISRICQITSIESQKELLWSIYHLRKSCPPNVWGQSILSSGLINFLNSCLVLNNPSLCQISLSCIFFYLHNFQRTAFNDEIIFQLILSDSIEERTLGLWAAGEMITIDENYTFKLLDDNILGNIMQMINCATYDAKNDAVYLLSRIVSKHYIEDFIEDNEVLQILIEFLSGDNDLMVTLSVLEAIKTVLESHDDLDHLVQDEFTISVLEELAESDNDEIASCASYILDEFVYEDTE